MCCMKSLGQTDSRGCTITSFLSQVTVLSNAKAGKLPCCWLRGTASQVPFMDPLLATSKMSCWFMHTTTGCDAVLAPQPYATIEILNCQQHKTGLKRKERNDEKYIFLKKNKIKNGIPPQWHFNWHKCKIAHILTLSVMASIGGRQLLCSDGFYLP